MSTVYSDMLVFIVICIIMEHRYCVTVYSNMQLFIVIVHSNVLLFRVMVHSNGYVYSNDLLTLQECYRSCPVIVLA